MNSCGERLLEIREIGLNFYWDLWYPPVSHHCMENMRKDNIRSSESNKPPSLTLKNLTGAFIILFVGIGLSLCAFIYEHISSTFFGRRDEKPRVTIRMRRFRNWFWNLAKIDISAFTMIFLALVVSYVLVIVPCDINVC